MQPSVRRGRLVQQPGRWRRPIRWYGGRCWCRGRRRAVAGGQGSSAWCGGGCKGPDCRLPGARESLGRVCRQGGSGHVRRQGGSGHIPGCLSGWICSLPGAIYPREGANEPGRPLTACTHPALQHARTHARRHARTHACTHARTHAHTHARTHARTCSHTLASRRRCWRRCAARHYRSAIGTR
jgi:hypothetical protein